MKVKRFLAMAFVLLTVACSSTMKAIEYAEPRISTKMTQVIWLDPKNLYQHRNVYVRVMNTSGYQAIDFMDLLKRKIREAGLNVVEDPDKANYILQVNVFYLDEERESLTADSMLAGGASGAFAGSYIGGSALENVAGAIGGATIGSIIGGLIGRRVAVNSFSGITEVRIQENVNGFRKEYKTRISIKAEQTNMDRDQVLKILADRLATQISNIFVY